ncbi:uridine kinase [Actinoplanes sp. NPDC048988]|uniref:uridine kinase family protein n=1 Tax=Actinoplanes sp. NPDC048988 TaxID=3363901 RepID=UPI003715A314
METVVEALLDDGFSRGSGPRVIAVDGRGGSGKTTFASSLAASIDGAVLVHTDDVAWWHSRFDWAPAMIDGILAPLRSGEDVRFTPPGWEAHGRTGEIFVPASASAVIVEGCGASRRELARYLDVTVWVQSPFDEARARGLQRDVVEKGLPMADAEREWDEWMAEEIPFFLSDQPWRRADLIVSGFGDLRVA